MTGKEVKAKIDQLGISQAKIAEKMGLFPQSFNKSLQAEDVKSGFIEKLCTVLDKDLSFFYGDTVSAGQEELDRLRKENQELHEELRRKSDPGLSTKESEVYRLWMEHMRITEKMQELYQKEKEGV